VAARRKQRDHFEGTQQKLREKVKARRSIRREKRVTWTAKKKKAQHDEQSRPTRYLDQNGGRDVQVRKRAPDKKRKGHRLNEVKIFSLMRGNLKGEIQGRV